MHWADFSQNLPITDDLGQQHLGLHGALALCLSLCKTSQNRGPGLPYTKLARVYDSQPACANPYQLLGAYFNDSRFEG